MKIYNIDGKEYYRVEDVKEYFLKTLYKEDVLAAIKIVKAEINMREIVFKNDRAKRIVKVSEMEHVLKVLSRFTESFPRLQKEMFR